MLTGEYDHGDRISYSEMKKLWLITSHKVDRLTEDFESMRQVVSKLVDAIAKKGDKTKRRGGRTGVSL